jgi:LuxR family maltose regulon positive regulatory protein
MSAGLLAGARYERNDLAGAQRLIDTYAWSMHEHLFVDARFFAYRTLARMENQRRQRRMAISTLERILDVGSSTRWVRMHVDTLAEKVNVALEQMNFRMARAYIDSIADQIETLMQDEEPWRGYLEAMLAVCEAELAIVTGQPTQAIELLIPIVKADFRSHWRLRAIQRSVLLVRAFWRSGREAASMILLNRIMDIAASDGIFRSLLDGGPDIALVLNLSIQRSTGRKTGNRNRRRYIEALRDAFEPCSVESGHAELREAKREQDNLTEREKELVRLTKTGMTNREIAKLMQVSENTIKWHLKNVFEKLGVSRRNELLTISL